MPNTIINTKNDDSIASERIGGHQLIVLRAGKRHTLSIADEDGWMHSVKVLHGEVIWESEPGNPVHRVGEPPFTINAGVGDQKFIATRGDFVVLFFVGLISPPGTIRTNPINP